MKNEISIGKVKEEWGWMGNMGKCELEYEGKRYKSCEGLFICLRFENEGIKEKLRLVDNGGMMVKYVSKRYYDNMVIERGSERDVENMKEVVRLKVNSYSWMKRMLIESGDRFIYENVGKRRNKGNNMFWGGYFEEGKFYGNNMLGKVWMELREELIINV